MKKKIMTLIVGVCAAAALVGCGKLSNDNVTVNKYKGLEVEKVEVEKVTDEDVESSIQSTLEAKSVKNDVTGRPVKDGDVTVIDFVGKKDGVPFENGDGKDFELEIGSGRFIEGFEEGIIGHNIGETFDLNLKFPEEYQSEELAGADVVFTVTLKGIKEVSIPTLNDEFVQSVSLKSKTVDEFKKEVKEDLKKSNKEAAEASFEQNVWQALVDNCEIKKYPKDKKEELTERINTQYGQTASMYGFEDAEAFVKQIYGISIKEMVDNIIKQEIAVDLIAKKENLKLTDKEYKEKLDKYVAEQGYTDAAQLEEQAGKENLEQFFLQEKVADWLIDNCKQVEPKKDKKDK